MSKEKEYQIPENEQGYDLNGDGTLDDEEVLGMAFTENEEKQKAKGILGFLKRDTRE